MLQILQEMVAVVVGQVGGLSTQQQSQVSGGGGYSVVQGLIAYKPPRRDENCRICNMLETEGDTDNLYDDHIHNFPTGCPRYINMTMKQRADIARKAKLCLNCHDPEYTYKGVDRNHNCSKGKKSRYTCTNCLYRYIETSFLWSSCGFYQLPCMCTQDHDN